MNLNDYIKIILTGFFNNREFLSDYFYREYKKAEKENIGAIEFFKYLIDANEVFQIEINNKFYKRLHEVALIKNIRESQGQSTEDLIEQEPELSHFSAHLYSLTNGKFQGDLWIADVNFITEAISNSLNEVKKEIPQNDIRQSENEMCKFDLTKYDLTTHNVTPYFPKPFFNGKEYCIYEGAIGNNRFQYFRVPQNSKAGKLSKQFVENYYIKNKVRHEYYNYGQTLIEACKIDAIEQLTGPNAYLKYWKDCLTENDKLINNIYSIHHIEALKEWYNLNIKQHILNNESQLFDEDIRNAEIENFKDRTAKSVEDYLLKSERKGIRHSAISRTNANQLIKFYKWLFETTTDKEEKAIESWKDLIKNELHDRLNEIENKVQNNISNWRQRKSLIECAAFCQLLFDKIYFVKGSTKRKSVNSFALSKYGTDITVQLGSAKKSDRELHKKKLEKYFK